MAMNKQIRVIQVSTVTPTGSLSDIAPVKLCFFDVRWILLDPVQSLLFYDTDTSAFPSLVQSLKQSLSCALRHFRPLAGRLVYSESSKELEIHCTNAGILFYETESDHDITHFVGSSVQDVQAFKSLVPELKTTDLPAPLLSVQVNRFQAGGIAVGLAIHHVAVDGLSMWQFYRSWAKMCRTGEATGPIISWDRAPFRDPYGLEVSKALVHERAPNLPEPELKVKGGFVPSDPTPLMRRTFVVTPPHIQLLKARAMQGRPDGAVQISTFVAITAHAWICDCRAKSLKHGNEDAYLFYLADCRKYLTSHSSVEYFGNCVRPCFITAKASKLIGQDGFDFATKMIQASIREVREDPLRDCKTWPKPFPRLSNLWMSVVGTPLSNSYDVDFGWGRPSKTEIVSLDSEGFLGLADARDGGVQVSVTLAPQDMEKFAFFFIDGLDFGYGKEMEVVI